MNLGLIAFKKVPDPRDQAAAPNCHEDSVQARDLTRQLDAEQALVEYVSSTVCRKTTLAEETREILTAEHHLLIKLLQ